VSLLLGLGLFLLALKLRRAKTPRNARRVFLASLVYLPLLMLFMVLDGHPHGRSDALSIAVKPATEASTAIDARDWGGPTHTSLKR
jgi:hypothetical protein